MQKILFITICLFFTFSYQLSACVIPVSIDNRASSSKFILLGKPIRQHSYYSKNNIFTRTEFSILASIKGKYKSKTAVLITLGGQIGDDLQIAYPVSSINFTESYILFLDKDDIDNDDKVFRKKYPKTIQTFSVADSQGYVTVKDGMFNDIAYEPIDVQDALSHIMHHSDQEKAMDVDGREFDMHGIATVTQRLPSARVASVSGITNGAGVAKPNYRAGLIAVTEELIINGSGFGTVAGSVTFPNADNGGSSVIGQISTTDILSWTDTKIRVKIPFQAGTGTMNVIDNTAGILASYPIKIEYAVIAFYSVYQGFTTTSRQMVELVNKNTLGGYSFQYTNSMLAVPAAMSEFETALNTWVCATGVNYRVNSTPSATQTINPNDEINIVTFDNTLLNPGVAARCNVRYKGRANTTCNKENTFWFVTDIDIQFSTDYAWNYASALPSASEVDFESIALHELGHSLTLGHVINPINVMHYILPAGQAHRTLELTSQRAANYVVAECTTQNCFQANLATAFQPMTLQSTTGSCPAITDDGSNGSGGGNGSTCLPKCTKIMVRKN